MASKLSPVNESKTTFTFECPGCGSHHHLWTDRWKFDGNFEAPTVTPSLLVSWNWKEEKHVCHFIITKGEMFFCSDCTHPNAGKTLPMLDVEE